MLTLLVALILGGCNDNPISEGPSADVDSAEARKASGQPFAVSGSAVHYLSTAVIHSQEQTENGMIQRSTDTIALSGDLNGFILYHPTSVFDFEAGTLVNTGTQMFSGTVAGSAPVILHDDSYRFEVDLATGTVNGAVYLGRSKDAPHPGSWYECTLEIVGTGVSPEGDTLSDYSGECTPRGNTR
jgi:hypothetical protein